MGTAQGRISMVSMFWIEAFNRTSGLSTGLDDYYRLRHNGRFVRGADRRAAKVPSEYEAKAKRQTRSLVPNPRGTPGWALQRV
jgi:hypothetical protein